MSHSITRAQSVGRQVRAVLAEHGVHQSQIAEALGMTSDAMSRRVAGKVSFRADELMQIAEHLQMDPARFLRPVPQPRAREDPDPALAGAARGAA